MATDTAVNSLIINKLTKAQYDAIQSKSDTELYLVPDEIDATPTSGSENPITSGGVYSALSGKQDTIDSSHKLSADLISDGTTNKVYTATEKTKLSGIAAGAEVNVQADWNQTTTTADDYIKNKPTNVSAFTNDAGYLTQHQDISGKADKSSTVSTVTYDTTNKKITKTINGTTTDVVTASSIVTDGGAVTNVSINGNNVRVTKNGTNTDLTVPYSTNSGTATKLGSSTVGDSSKPIYLKNGVPTQVSTIDGSIVGGYIGYDKKGYLVTHPEALNGIVVPFLYNDIAFLRSRGGDVSIYSTTSTDLTADTLTVKTDWNSLSNKDNLFNACAEYWTVGNTYATEMNSDGLIIDITLHKTFTYTNVFYIDFGKSDWGYSYVDVFVKNSANETAYVNKVTNGAVNNKSQYYIKFSHTSTNTSGDSVSGFNKMRIYLHDRDSTWGVRIAQIGLIYYASQGHRETVMSRGYDDKVWRSISPATTNSYSIGTSSYRWSNICSVLGNFSGLITASGGVTIPSGKSLTIGSTSFTGSYNDLTNKPTIPAVSALTNNEIDTIWNNIMT